MSYTDREYIQEYRIDILYEMPKNAVCAELGVAHGDWAKTIVEITEPKEFWLVDVFKYQSIKRFVRNYFAIRPNVPCLKVLKGNFNFLELPKNYFDWLYFDLDHRYEQTLMYLKKSFELLKIGGIMIGDDYGEFHSPPFPETFPYGDEEFLTVDFPTYKGVKKAVDEFVENDRVEVEYLNKNELRNSLQFKLKRLS